MPRMKIVVGYLLHRCPTCGFSIRYDGTAKDCPECAKREKELAGISDIGAPLARKAAR